MDDSIKKMAFITNIDNTNEIVIEKVVIFREGQEPLIEDYSKNKHMLYLIKEKEKENISDFGTSIIETLKKNGFLEVANKNNIEQINHLRAEIEEEKNRYIKEQNTTPNLPEDEEDYSKYSDGVLRTDFYDNPKANLDKIAEQFSEGDKMLQETLVALWKNGIKTTACCRGHLEKGRSHHPYIQLIKDDKSEEFINATIDYMLLYGNLELEFKNYGKGYDEFIIDMSSEEGKKKYFNFVNYYLTHKNEYEKLDNNRMKYADCLLKTAKENGLNCSFVLTKDEMGFSFSKPGYGIMYTDDIKDLDNKDTIYYVKECVNSFRIIPCEPFKCSEKSLEQFLHIINPRLFNDNSIHR